TRWPRDWSSDVCSSDLPVPEPHRLTQIKIPKMNFGISEYSDNLSYPLFQQVRDHQQAFSGIFGWAYTTLRIGQGAEARRASVLEIGRASCREGGGGWGA